MFPVPMMAMQQQMMMQQEMMRQQQMMMQGPMAMPANPMVIAAMQQQMRRNEMEVRKKVFESIAHTNPILMGTAELGHKQRLTFSKYTGAGVRYLYHQTSEEAAEAILESQEFRPGKDGAGGAGIYFAESPEDTNRKAIKKGVILKAKVNLGNCGVMHCHMNMYPSDLEDCILQGHDSVLIIGMPSGPEFIIFSSDQVSNITRHKGRK